MMCSVVLHAGLLNNVDLGGKVAVVIDAFRATSVIVEAMSNGAQAFIPVKTVEEALAIKQDNPSFLLGGERNGFKIDGFDLDNSPLSYTHELVEGKTIVLTTTNGTRALRGALSASAAYVGAFLNLEAVARKIADAKEVVIICSGSEDAVSLEDSLCAGALLYKLEAYATIAYTDEAIMLKELFASVRGSLQDFASNGVHYKYLKSKGFSDDLGFCLQESKRNVVPRLVGTTVVL